MNRHILIFSRKNYSDLRKIVPYSKIHNHVIGERIIFTTEMHIVQYVTSRAGFLRNILGVIIFIRKTFDDHY